MLRLVIDTNIWVSALWGSHSAVLLLKTWQDDHFELVCCELLIDELDRVWRRPRFKKRIQAGEANILLNQIRLRGYFVKPSSIPPNCRDPKDHPVLAVAIDGKASNCSKSDGRPNLAKASVHAFTSFAVKPSQGCARFLSNYQG